jgi:hypothetical protein
MNERSDPQQDDDDHVFTHPPEDVTAAAETVFAALQQLSPLDDAQLAGNTGLEPTLVVLAAARLVREGLVGMRARDDGSYLFWLVEQTGAEGRIGHA